MKRRSAVVAFLIALSYLTSFGTETASAEARTMDIRSSGERRYGAHIDSCGWVHFVVFAPDAEQVNLLLFDKADSTHPKHIIPMERCEDDWKIKLKGEGIGVGSLYMYRAEGTNEVSQDDQYGLMFNENHYLNDPYAYKTQGVRYSSFFSSVPYADIVSPVYAGGGKSVVYDHSRDIDPGHVEMNREDLIIYELHVQDYTARIPGLDSIKRGAYLALAQSGLKTPGGLAAGIDHLVELGVTAVELMPVMEYDEETGNVEGRYNHWGYMTTNFIAPEARYSSSDGNQIEELKLLVRAFHETGIAVFMDVVYNHTGEQSPWTDSGGERIAAKYYNFM